MIRRKIINSRRCNLLMINDIANLLKTTSEKLMNLCSDELALVDTRVKFLSPSERDSIILKVVKEIYEEPVKVKQKADIWEDNWGDTHKKFLQSGCDLSALTPEYVHPGRPVRMFGEFAQPNDPWFELTFYQLYRNYLFKEFFNANTIHRFSNIYEFGCGSGYNLVALSRILPKSNLIGCDYSRSSVQLLSSIANASESTSMITGYLFDMKYPGGITIAPDSAVFTVGSLEQLSNDITPMIDYLIQQRPEVCLHIEPVIDFYDSNKLVDALAIAYHRKRKYTDNLLSTLRDLEKKNKIEIITAFRPYFGSLFMEGYSCIVWKPR